MIMKGDDLSLDELIKGMTNLEFKFVRLEKKGLDFGCDGVVNICSKDFFHEIRIFIDLKKLIHEVRVETKYKTVRRK